MAELTTAEKAAYQASFNRTKKQQARDKGTEDAGGSALERARQRALGDDVTKANGLGAGTIQPTKPQSQRIIQQPDGSRVPESFYDLTPEQQRTFKRLVKEQENLASGETHFDQVSLALLDQQAAQATRVTNLERLVESLVGENLELRRRQDNVDLTVEVAKSEALEGQESSIAQMATNLLTIKLQASAEMEQYNRQRDEAAAESREQLEAQATAIEALRASVKSTTTLMGERSNAVVSQLASIEGRVAKTEVTQVELEGRTDALGTPITRDEMRAIVTSTVAAEFPSQLPAMVSKELAVQAATGELGEGIEIDRGYLSQSLENSDERSKRFDVTQKQIDESKFTNPTERAIRRALKKGGRG